MMLQPGSWISRTLAIAILILALLAVHHFLFMPVWNRYAANEHRILQMGNLLERYRTLDAARPDIVDRLAEMQSRDELVTDGYWQGESDVQTATKLQDRASQSVKAEGGNVISMQTLDPEETEGQELPIRRALLKMRLATTLEGLAATVYDIETAVPYMFIDHLIVTPQRSGRRIAGQTETSDQEQKLDVRLNVFGYVRDQSPPSAEIEEGEG